MTTTLRCLLAASLLATSVFAQTSFTSPLGYDSKTGGFNGYIFSDLMNGRTQYGEGGKAFNGTAMIIGRINYRTMTNRTYSPALATGRTWTNVAVTMAGGDLSKMTTAYTTNFLRKPTVMFNAKFSLPTQTIASPKQVWGNTASFGFNGVFVKQKGEDLIHDYQWSGGKLANGRTVVGAIYMHDGIKVPSFNSASVTRLPASSTCNDSAIASTNGALTFSTAAAFPNSYSVPTYRNTIRISHYSQYTAPGGKVIRAASLGGNDKGVPAPGFGCNRLFVKLGTMLGMDFSTAPNSTTARTSIVTSILKYNQVFVGLPIYMQGAWEDSKTKQPKLTQATTWKVPALPAAGPERRLIYSFTPSSKPMGPYSPAHFDYLFATPRFQLK